MADNCISPENRAFLVGLLDLSEIIGADELEKKCKAKMAPGEECSIDRERFEAELKEAAMALSGIKLCGGV